MLQDSSSGKKGKKKQGETTRGKRRGGAGTCCSAELNRGNERVLCGMDGAHGVGGEGERGNGCAHVLDE